MAFSERIPAGMDERMVELVEQQFRKHNPGVNPISKKARRWVRENTGIEAIWDINRHRFHPYRIVCDQKFVMFKMMV